MRYEYIRLYLDFGDLDPLRALGQAGWRVVTVVRDERSLAEMQFQPGEFVALLERPLPDPQAGEVKWVRVGHEDKELG